MFQFLLIVQTLVAVAMIAVILMQRSEGGGLAGGGSPSGMMSARGAADFLTRSTTILAILFVA
ncbi:MAG: preprotein translocase subunit SecG, partial [Sphingosinicella sp.]|uniref:preprotein translocase subunit SecG n=1 Tax=Sphingosinicella sp. TaxID=1917971 RepID=UPI0040375F73